MATSARQPPVLVLRGVVKTLHAGVSGCRATARVLAGVDLVLRRGERVAILGRAETAARMLLLISAGLLRPDVGEVWAAPGVRLLRRVVDGSRVRGVAERAPHALDLLCWPDDPHTTLALGPLAHERGRVVRRFAVHHGRLAPLARSR